MLQPDAFTTVLHHAFRPQSSIHILLVEPDLPKASDLKRALRDVFGERLVVVHSTEPTDALRQLETGQFDVVLLSIALTVDDGPPLLRQIIELYPSIPVVALTDVRHEALAIQALRMGVEEYVVMEELHADRLMRVICCAAVRHQTTRELQLLSSTDPLTGLYNRRAFMTLGEQQLKLARRNDYAVVVGFADIDRLKVINDSCGHSHGDLALQDTASILRSTFRASDVLARIGGDEFVVLSLATEIAAIKTLRGRLEKNMFVYRTQNRRSFDLSLSIGLCQYERGFGETLPEMLMQTDQRMYDEKRGGRDS